jgi:hypothetical protein
MTDIDYFWTKTFGEDTYGRHALYRSETEHPHEKEARKKCNASPTPFCGPSWTL